MAVGLAGCGSSSADSVSAECVKIREYTMGLRYQQGPEVQALQEQAYQLATKRLEEAIADGPSNRPFAVVTDLDETVIDDTKVLAGDLAECRDYNTDYTSWTEWNRTGGEQSLIPGAKHFFDYAAAQGVVIYYISNREEEHLQPTLEVMKRLGLPGADTEHVLLPGPPKADRRAKVASDHTIVLQLGDTLHDFDGQFADTSLQQQHDAVQDNATRFGDDWIVLPNSAYGNWSEGELEEWQP